MGQIRCGGPAVIVAHPLCHCDNCAGTGEAYALASLWSIARSPLLFGGDLPADAQTLSMLTNPDFLAIHARARNQTVFEFSQVNETKGAPLLKGQWVKWWADLATLPPATGGGYGGLGWSRRRATSTSDTAVKAVLVINVGGTADTATTAWQDLGLPARAGGWQATDIWSQHIATSTPNGFASSLGARNATLYLVGPRQSATHQTSKTTMTLKTDDAVASSCVLLLAETVQTKI